jgi:hypothetical protein
MMGKDKTMKRFANTFVLTASILGCMSLLTPATTLAAGKAPSAGCKPAAAPAKQAPAPVVKSAATPAPKPAPAPIIVPKPVSLPTLKPAPTPVAKPAASQTSATGKSVQASTTVNIGPVGVSLSCGVSGKRNCSATISATGLGLTGSVSTNGDLCGGAGGSLGLGLYGAGSDVLCKNLGNGSTSVQISGSLGLGISTGAVNIVGIDSGATYTVPTSTNTKGH